MEYSHIEIESFVRRAQQQRAEAMNDVFSHGWKRVKQLLSRLTHHHSHSDNHLAHS